MCNPTTALVATSIASAGLQFQQAKAQQKAQYNAQKRQNEGDAGIAISGSTEALLADYYRTEGKYKASLAKNLEINIGQFEKNLEAIQFGQESQQTYLTPPNPELLFATQALNVANTYYSLEATKEAKGLKTQRQKRNYPTPNEGADD